MSEITFGFADVEEIKGRIDPGVEECTILGVAHETSENGKAYVKVSIVSNDANREHTERLYVTTEKGTAMTLKRLKSLIRDCVGEDKSNGSYNIEQLNKMLAGKQVRLKFVGEEYLNNNDEVSVRVNLAFSGFSEPISVPAASTKLKYNPSNKYDYKKLPIEPNKGLSSGGTEIQIDDNAF